MIGVIVGILIISGIVATVGLARAIASLRQVVVAATQAGIAAAEVAAELAYTAAVEAMPHLRYAAAMFVCNFLLSIVLLGIGITTGWGIVTITAGLLFTFSLLFAIGAIGMIARVLQVLANTVEFAANLFVNSLTTILSWLGMAKNTAGQIQIFSPRAVAARIESAKPTILMVWWLVISACAIFPSWYLLTCVFSVLGICLITGYFIAKKHDWSIIIFWRCYYTFMTVAFAYTILTAPFPGFNKHMAVRVENWGLDNLVCDVAHADIVYCRDRANLQRIRKLRGIADDAADWANEHMSSSSAVLPVTAGGVSMITGVPRGVPLGSGSSAAHAPPP